MNNEEDDLRNLGHLPCQYLDHSEARRLSRKLADMDRLSYAYQIPWIPRWGYRHTLRLMAEAARARAKRDAGVPLTRCARILWYYNKMGMSITVHVKKV